MALHSRLFYRSINALCRNEPSSLSIWNRTFFTGSQTLSSTEDYWAKNDRLKRPTSPHMTIYKPQLTSLLSLSHRASGLALAAALSGFGIGMLFLPGSFPHYVGLIETMNYGSAMIFMAKFSLAFPIAFHVTNGIRHLAWDLGYGFDLRTLYKSGYSVLGLAFVVACIAAMM